MQEFAAFLRSVREARGMTVNQLAMYSGISAAQLSRIENGKRGVPKPATLQKLAEALKLDYTVLMEKAGYLAQAAYPAADSKVMVVMEQGNDSLRHESPLSAHERIVLEELRKYPAFMAALATEPAQIKRLVKLWTVMKDEGEHVDETGDKRE